jgi:hypothetical protein
MKKPWHQGSRPQPVVLVLFAEHVHKSLLFREYHQVSKDDERDILADTAKHPPNHWNAKNSDYGKKNPQP